MNAGRGSPHRIFTGILYAAGFVSLAAENYGRLLTVVALYGSFGLVCLLQSVLTPPDRDSSAAGWGFHLAKFGLAAVSLYLTEGMGAAFMIYIAQLDLCFRQALLPSGVASALMLCAMLALLPFTPAVWILHATLFTAIFLLAHSVRKEQELARSLSGSLSALRVQEKKLADMNGRMEQMNERLEEAARQEERSRILKGIHDTLGYILTSVTVQLSAALTLFGKDADGVRSHLLTARDQARQGLQGVRDMIGAMDDAGLTFRAKIRRIVDESEKGMNIRILTVMEDMTCVSGELEQIILSSVREGLTNGVRHGRATAFILKIERNAEKLHCYLEDNGSGCADLHKGYGLTAMEERLEQRGGSLDAGGIPDGGFFLRFTLPVRSGGEGGER